MPKPPKPRGYIVGSILPKHTIHIISGGSGSWKTTLQLALVEKWENGEDIFGHASFPAPWAYVSFDRPLADAWDTLADIRFEPPEQLINSAYDDKTISRTGEGLIKCMDRFLPKGGLLAVDGLGFIAPIAKNAMEQYQAVWRFNQMLIEAMQKRDVTILTNAHNPKMRKGEELINPRDRILGSVAWSGTCGTVLSLEVVSDDERKLSVLPRSKVPNFYKSLKRESKSDGRLIISDWIPRIEVEQDTSKAGNIHLDNMLAESQDEEITRENVVEWADKMDISLRTAERWLKNKIDSGELVRIARGRYKKPQPQ